MVSPKPVAGKSLREPNNLDRIGLGELVRPIQVAAFGLGPSAQAADECSPLCGAQLIPF
jgi:hypothetical protein